MGEVDTFVGYKEGWRWWNLSLPPYCSSQDEVVLYSIAPHFVEYYKWKWSEENKTDCPKLYDDCGFHAYKKEYMDSMGATFSHTPPLVGNVAMYGDICLHEYGYRAERAVILNVWCNPQHWNKIKDVPQVKGTFTVEVAGEESGWLKLENRKELKGGNLSNTPITFLPLNKCRK